jgi:hypothetical protein
MQRTTDPPQMLAIHGICRTLAATWQQIAADP